MTLLESLPPGRELALAYAILAANCKDAMRREEAVAWGERALDLAERLDDAEIAVHAPDTIGLCQEDYEKLEQCLERARHAGLAEQVGRTFALLADRGG